MSVSKGGACVALRTIGATLGSLRTYWRGPCDCYTSQQRDELMPFQLTELHSLPQPGESETA